MKKQIFILVFALFITSIVFGQVNPNPKVSQKPTCAATESSPSAGKLYNYKADIAFTAGFAGNGKYDWYVTQNTNLIDPASIMADGGTDFVATGKYHGVAGSVNTIGITWSAASIVNSNPYYLVIKYSETNGTCNPENIRVYRIKPQNTFWLKLESALADGTPETTYKYCPSPIASAVYNEGSSTVQYKYGSNVIYALITAGGYTGDWDVKLQLSNIQDDQAISSIVWKDITGGIKTGSFTAPGSIAYGAGVAGVWTGSLPSTDANTQILVTITLNNNFHQGLTDQAINIAVDGSITSGATVLNDLSDVTASCTPEAAYADYVISTIKARPTINPNNPASFASDPTTKP